MKTILRQMFSGRDNRTIDMARVVGFEILHFYLAISIYAIHKGGTFDPLTWGAGAASIMAATGAWIGLKAGTEPVPTALSITTKDGTSFSQKVGKQTSDDSYVSPGMPQPPARLGDE